MLSPKAHLKTWLKFADDERPCEQVLSGARRLDHWTPDAFEKLGKDEYTALTLLKDLPVVDLKATAPLCYLPRGCCTGNSRRSIAPRR
jgi:hypothetical protein